MGRTDKVRGVTVLNSSFGDSQKTLLVRADLRGPRPESAVVESGPVTVSPLLQRTVGPNVECLKSQL